MKQMESISLLLKNLRQTAPLIHCITNHISINDCANAVLALGARPIMAEHPDEAAEITGHAQALVLNLGNISAPAWKLCGQLGVRQPGNLVSLSCSTPPGWGAAHCAGHFLQN